MFGAAVARRLNSTRHIAQPGFLFMSDATGTGYAPLPRNLREPSVEIRPWSFFCTESNGVRTGGWHRQIVQVGLDVYNYKLPVEGFIDETECADGDHYLKIDLNEDGSSRVTIVRTEADAGATFADVPHGILAVYIGTVLDGKQTRGIYWPPVIYHYL